MDIGALETLHGRVAVGWLIFEDLATVAILVLLPVLVSPRPIERVARARAGHWASAALRRADAVCRQPHRGRDPPGRRRDAVPRAVRARGVDRGARHRAGFCGVVRRLARARRVRRRRGRQRVAVQPPGQRRSPPVPRGVRGALLRVGGHAGESRLPARALGPGRGPHRAHRCRQIGTGGAHHRSRFLIRRARRLSWRPGSARSASSRSSSARAVSRSACSTTLSTR